TYLLLFVVLISTAQAQQGCCSWHGGIDYCGYDGYYMCNDGTRSPTCTCNDYLDDEEDDESLTSQAFKTSVSIILNMDSMQKLYGATSVCENIPFQRNLNNMIITQFSNSLNDYRSVGAIGNPIYADTEGAIAQYQILGQYLNRIEAENCNIQSCPSNSAGTWGSCICNDGYLWKDDKCITYNERCRLTFGSNAHGDKDYCYCNDGFEFNTDKTNCVRKSSVPSSTTNSFSPTNNELETSSKMYDRVCPRVINRFLNDSKMWKRVNDRIQKRFGFVCNK
ncbi:hypothetical protein KJ996_05055, partial [Patescibacteria group bacterium]|nr:hypothetical protein [Patescibacteria group bacterium]